MDETVEDFLAHYGVKGMRWGVRKKRRISPPGEEGSPTSKRRSPGEEVKVEVRPGKKLKVSGGKGQLPSEDAIRTAALVQKAKKSGVQSLSNAELKALTDRMSSEQNFAKNYKKYKEANTPVLKRFIQTQGKDWAQKQLKENGKDWAQLAIAAKKFNIDLSKIKITSLT